MVNIIMGAKGTGKTKKLIEMVNADAENNKGHVICLEYGDGLKYDISSKVRLINTKDYHIKGFEAFSGFIKGLFACNYDITSVFVDGALKITGPNLEKMGETLEDIDKVAGDAKLIVLVSANIDEAPDSLKKFIK